MMFLNEHTCVLNSINSDLCNQALLHLITVSGDTLTIKIQFSEPLHLDERPNERSHFFAGDTIAWSHEQKQKGM